MVDAAVSTGPKSYDWKNAVHVWLDVNEVGAVLAVFRRWRKGIEFGAHGSQNDKSFSIEFQGQHFFAKVSAKSLTCSCRGSGKARQWRSSAASSPSRETASISTGRASCSALGYRVVRRHGVFGGLGLIRARTARCAQIHDAHHPAMAAPRPRLTRADQRGDCDLGCDLLPCDGPDLSDACGQRAGRSYCGQLLDASDCCSCCDGYSRDRKNAQPMRASRKKKSPSRGF